MKSTGAVVSRLHENTDSRPESQLMESVSGRQRRPGPLTLAHTFVIFALAMRQLFILTLLLASFSFSQPSGGARFEFLPSGLHFAAIKANLQEPRIGVLKFLDAGEMKVDIGNSIDVAGVSFDGNRITIGIEFMAYAYTTGAQGLRLQIDAIDGFFGGNMSFSKPNGRGSTIARLRLLHHSAHMVDGHYSKRTKSWIDGREPIPFTRDFGEVVIGQIQTAKEFRLRYYGGLSYATLVRPTDVKRLAYLAGLEASLQCKSALLKRDVNPFLAYQTTLSGIPSYIATHQVQAGMKFGTWEGKGPALYLLYHHGMHMFAEYYDVRLTTLGLGFTMDFF